MGKRPTRSVPRARTNYNWLLAELQAQEEAPRDEPASAPPQKGMPPAFSPARQRLMSDERVRYLYVKGGNFHDKTCPAAREIRDEDLRWSETYLNHLPQCPLCQTKAYLRAGARDMARCSDYEKLFQKMGFSPKLLRRMYIHEKLRTEYLSPGRLKIWSREDTWLLEEIPGSEHLRLLHNNYRQLPDGTRQLVSGYHEQVVCASAQYAIAVIAGYTYDGHKAAMEKKHTAAAPAAAAVDTAPPPTPGLWERFRHWIRRLLGK